MHSPATSPALYGAQGKLLVVDLSSGTHHVEALPEAVFRAYLGGYGLGAWLMWTRFPARADALAPEACFAIVAGLLTGTRAPFSSRIQIVGKSPLTGTWADSNSGGSVAAQLRAAGYDALLVTGRAATPTVLVVRDDEVLLEPAGEVWGKEVPATFDALRARYGSKHEVGVSAIGPAGERQALIASVMNDRYHAFGRSGFGAVYGSKNLKAIVVGGSGKVPVAQPAAFDALCKGVTQEYKRDVGWLTRLMAWLIFAKRWLGWLYRLSSRRKASKVKTPVAAMRRAFSQRGTTLGVALSTENGDAPVKNWLGVGARDFPIGTRSMKLDGAAVEPLITKRLSCGDCPMPCKGIVKVPERKLEDVRRPDYESLCGFGANLLVDDLPVVVACHDACNRYGMDVISASATLGWAAEAFERGLLTTEALDGTPLRWGDGEAVLALTIKMGTGEGCGAWLGQGVARASRHLGRGSEDFAIHVHGQEPAYHDPRFSSLMGVTFISDPTPGRHTAGSGSWNEAFGTAFQLPEAAPQSAWEVQWGGTEGKGRAQALFSSSHQVLNGLGLCMFTGLTGNPPWLAMVRALTGWQVTEADLLRCGERIQALRAAFNWREGLTPESFVPHRRLLGEGDGLLTAGPLKGVTVPLRELRRDYFEALGCNPETGRLRRARAEELGLTELLGEWVDEPTGVVFPRDAAPETPGAVEAAAP
ncbi:MAG: aldehyde ferredoxin oxidoreductase family protein [Deltaproteobacteria bacterium]|nr:aldehyde ferredoxin oxidoreductase family protein [Deltaproteobacteria bacterium]